MLQSPELLALPTKSYGHRISPVTVILRPRIQPQVQPGNAHPRRAQSPRRCGHALLHRLPHDLPEAVDLLGGRGAEKAAEMGVARLDRRNGCRNDERRIAAEVGKAEDFRAGAGREMLRRRLRIGPQPGQGPALHDHQVAKGNGQSAFAKRSKQ